MSALTQALGSGYLSKAVLSAYVTENGGELDEAMTRFQLLSLAEELAKSPAKKRKPRTYAKKAVQAVEEDEEDEEDDEEEDEDEKDESENVSRFRIFTGVLNSASDLAGKRKPIKRAPKKKSKKSKKGSKKTGTQTRARGKKTGRAVSNSSAEVDLEILFVDEAEDPSVDVGQFSVRKR